MKGKLAQTGLLIGLPGLLLGLCLWLQPFGTELARRTLAIQSLSESQRLNLQVAARHIDGLVLQPGEQFSFNRSVGPRTASRGYVAAPSYLGGESPDTLGGGICLLSSALYQLALAADFAIDERVAHLRTIRSVPPGLDATVWYGGADLKFTNTLSAPIRLHARMDRGALTLSLQGRDALQPQPLERRVERPNRQELRVSVFRGERLVSSDLYRLSP